VERPDLTTSHVVFGDPAYVAKYGQCRNRFMVSLSNHEVSHRCMCERSWFDKLTMKAARVALLQSGS